MAGTLSDMRTRLSSELRRPDLTTDMLNNAINDAISFYQTERFRFSDVDPANPDTFNTVIGRDVYDSNDAAILGTMHKVDRVYILIGNNNQVVTAEQPAVLRLYNQQNLMMGQSDAWAYEGNKLILSPIPSSVWQITIEAFRNVAAPANDAETGNMWMTDAEILIRCRAKYELAVHILRNPVLAASMSPYPPAPGALQGASYSEWRRLKSDTARITSIGRIRPMSF